jgi:hypothetical protein
MLFLRLPGCGPPPPVDKQIFETRAVVPAREHLEALQSLMAIADIEMESEGRRFTGRVRILYVSPGRIRIDAELPGFLGLLGGSGTLWADAEEFYWTSSAEPGLHAGADDPVFSEVLGRRPGVEDLEVLLFGLPAWWPAASERGRGAAILEADLAGDPGQGEALLTWPDATWERVTIGGDPPALQTLTRADEHGTVADAVYDGYRAVDGLELPGRVTVRSPRSGGWIVFRWRRYEVNRAGDISRLDWPG